MCDKKILLTGGAGYIGSHTNAILNAMGFKTLVVDNLSLGHKESLQYSLLDSFNTFDKDFNSHTKTLNKSLDFKDFTICNKHLNNTESNKKRRSHAISFLAQLAQSFNLGGGGNTQDFSINNAKSNLKFPFKQDLKNPHTTNFLESTPIQSLFYHLNNAYKNTTFIQADLGDSDALDSIFKTYEIQAVMHFCAFAYVGESVNNPSRYYRNNISHSLNLLESMLKYNVKTIIFSSTCATYGNPLSLPITESHPQNPINPYGYSKLVVENMLKDFNNAYGLNFVILRYFNAAGASMLFDIGESHSPETHLIPLLLQTALGQRKNLSIFGNDYPTKDGSCVRDYIHIDDLSSAHILALKYLLNGGKSDVFNLGNGEGFSIFELIDCVKNICGEKIPYTIESRRVGDPAVLIGDSSKARDILGWNPHFYNIDSIIQSAMRWHTNKRY